MNNSQNKNLLTEGSIWKKLMGFAFPLFLGNLFQQLYNTADSLIVGNFLGSDALAAVSSSGSLTFLLVGFFQGLAMGAGVIIARYFGARQKKELHRAIHTTVAFGILCGILLTAGGVVLAPKILILMKTPADILPKSTLYFQVYAMGSLGLVLYNNFVGIMQAVGDSRHPLYYLIFSSLLNVALDMVFVGGFGMGVEGAALATIISQFLSAAWVLRFLFSDRSILRLKRETMMLKKARVLKIVSMGMSSFAAGFTNSVVAVACNATLQTWGGDLYVGVMTVIHSVREIAENLVKGLTGGSQPVLGYNFGAGQYDRVKKAIRFLSVSTIAFTTFCWILISIFPETFIHIFNRDETLVQAAIPAVRVYFFGFFMMSLQYSGQACFIGLGKAKQATFFSIFRKVIIVLPLTLLFPRLGGLGAMGVFLAEPVSNFIGGAACYGTMLRTVWQELNKKKESA